MAARDVIRPESGEQCDPSLVEEFHSRFGELCGLATPALGNSLQRTAFAPPCDAE